MGCSCSASVAVVAPSVAVVAPTGKKPLPAGYTMPGKEPRRWKPASESNLRTAAIEEGASSSSSSKPSLVCDSAGSVKDHYLFDAELGHGTFATVHRGQHKRTGVAHAIKRMSTAVVLRNGLRRESEFMASLDHPNIISFTEVFEDAKLTYIVTELCEGGELLQKVQEMRSLSEAQSAHVMRQVLSAVSYMHERFVCHRDLKPENLLFMTKGAVEKSTVKVVDFGMACTFEPGMPMTKLAGTMEYIAPEVLLKQYDQSCDLWSTGCIAYLLLLGRLAFGGASQEETRRKVLAGKLHMRGSRWEGLSQEAKDLILALVHKQPSARATADEALDHTWVKQAVAPRPTLALDEAPAPPPAPVGVAAPLTAPAALRVRVEGAAPAPEAAVAERAEEREILECNRGIFERVPVPKGHRASKRVSPVDLAAHSYADVVAPSKGLQQPRNIRRSSPLMTPVRSAVRHHCSQPTLREASAAKACAADATCMPLPGGLGLGPKGEKVCESECETSFTNGSLELLSGSSSHASLRLVTSRQSSGLLSEGPSVEIMS